MTSNRLREKNFRSPTNELYTVFDRFIKESLIALIGALTSVIAFALLVDLLISARHGHPLLVLGQSPRGGDGRIRAQSESMYEFVLGLECRDEINELITR